MPKLIDYPRTSYNGAWELAEVTDDTGGKCAFETAARKLNRKVSGSFKAIIGSAVKFGLLTSKRDLLTTTTLFKRIKHAYDKQEEILFHREAFLTPPLFTQLCRKFRSRELPIQMLDVMLIREFNVEEINAQGVAKAFVDGCRMVGLLDERNIIADIDALAAKQTTRRELASPQPIINTFRQETDQVTPDESSRVVKLPPDSFPEFLSPEDPFMIPRPTIVPGRNENQDPIASLFGFMESSTDRTTDGNEQEKPEPIPEQEVIYAPRPTTVTQKPTLVNSISSTHPTTYQIQVSGPGLNTTLSITEEEDISIAIALLEKIRRQLRA